MSSEPIGSYEQHCNDYALFGDPMRDHYDYEEAAAYDRWDGHRGDFDCVDYDDPCPNCGYRADCPDCIAWRERADRAYREARESDCSACDDEVPF